MPMKNKIDQMNRITVRKR